MSTTIDQKVVEMRFDNKQFENNVSTTMSTLEKLKQSLNLSGASKGLETVDAAAKRINLSGLSSAAETVGLKFNAMYTMADQALRNITNSAVNTGKRIVSALTIDPIKTGLSEYETQIGAVQTILANTESKGTTLEDVNGALDELNTYADKTIYNFTEMTRNIGTFTAAGVDLDTSVKSIQGIANLAAVSGSTSQQASTAMYQLSQALAAGKVSLMDWNSVVNAGMGGQVFQDALKRTAESMGTDVDALIKKYGSFRESLTQGEWLTADVLTKTLEQFTMSAKEGSKEWEKYKKSLMDDGYTEKQAEEILKMANTATDAATKVKTASQLWDTLKETAQSGWTQTWEILFGDFEEAKQLFSDLYATISPLLEASAKARNDLLEGWAKAGGRADLIESVYNIFEAVGSFVKPIKEAFREIFPPTTVDQLVSFTEAIKNFTEKLVLSDTASGNLKRTFKGLFAILDIVKQAFGFVLDVISPLFGGIDNLGGSILETTAKWGDWLVAQDEAIKKSGFFSKAVESIHNAIEKVKTFLQPVIDWIKSFADSISTAFSDISVNVEERLGPLATLGNFLKNVFVETGKIISKIFPYISAAATGIGNVLSDLMGTITSSIQNADYNSLFDAANGGIIAAIGVFIAKFIKSGGDILDNAGGFLENINGILEGVGDALGAFTDSLKAETLKKIATAIGILAVSLLVLSLIPSEKLTTALIAITTLFGELMGAMAIFGKLSSPKGVAKLSGALISLSAALLILSVALKIMSTMSWEEMGVGLISLTVGMGALVGAVNLLPDKKVAGAAKAIKKMATAIVILAIGIKIMSTMSWEEMAVGLTAMVVSLGALVGAVNLLPKDTALRAAGMIGLATAMVILSAALKIMATMSWDEVARSLVTLAGSLGILAGAMALMKKAIPGAVAMMIVAPALVVLAGALKMMGGMSWEEIARGLVALGGSLLIIAGAMAIMKTAIAGAAALLVVTAALAVLAPVLKILGSMTWEEIARGLVAIAGAFAVMGVAALVLSPLIGSILALSGALLSLGVACAAIGAGAIMLGAGLTMISVAGSSAAVALVTIVASIISLIPYLIEQIGVGIIKLCDVIAGSADAICKAVTVIILAIVDALVQSVPAIVDGVLVLVDALLTSLVEYAPKIVNGLFDFIIGLIDALADRLPDLIQAGVNLLMSIFSGVVDALKSVDPSVLINGLTAVGVLSAIVLAMAAVAALTPLALVGVLGMGAVITELALVLSAIGALAQIPGLEWLVKEGGQFMQTVGTAIGQFFGGIVGGFAQGMSAALPQIGTDLSAFIINALPFITGVKLIDEAAINGVNALVGMVLALTAANLLEGLTSWLTGGSSITSFAEQLVPFGAAMVEFSNIVSGNIDEASVMAAANAGKIIAEMAATLPNSGGVLGFFAGENDMATFAEQIIPFGEAMANFATAVSGNINEDAVTAAANAGKAMAEMAATIPNTGGVVSWFTGDNDMVTFGEQLVAFGGAMVSFSRIISGKINEEAVTAAANAGKAMAEMASTLPNSGGVVSWFAGDNDMETFGKQMIVFGKAIVNFSNEVSDINVGSLDRAVRSFTKIADMARGVSGVNFDGLGGFGENLKKLGKSGIDAFILEFVNASKLVKDAGKSMIDNVIDGIESKATSLNKSIKTVAGDAAEAAEEKYDAFYDAGEYLVEGFADGIDENTYQAAAKARAMAKAASEAAEDELDINSPSRVGYGIGGYFGKGFVNAIIDYADKSYRAGSEMAGSAREGLSSTISKIGDYISSDIDAQPTIRPVLDLSDVKSGASAISGLFGASSVGVMANVGSINSMMNRRNQNGANAELLSAIDKLNKNIGKTGNTYNSIGGVTVEEGSDVSDAIKVIVRAAKVERRV